jgi:hypothetical protein
MRQLLVFFAGTIFGSLVTNKIWDIQLKRWVKKMKEELDQQDRQAIANALPPVLHV